MKDTLFDNLTLLDRSVQNVFIIAVDILRIRVGDTTRGSLIETGIVIIGLDITLHHPAPEKIEIGIEFRNEAVGDVRCLYHI